MRAIAPSEIESTVAEVLAHTQFVYMHTHLVPPSFGKLNLWGTDELLTYHYLEAEFFRSSDCRYDEYWVDDQATTGGRDLAIAVPGK